MTDLFAARSQMAMSLSFHIIFAAVGIAMPLLMAIAEGQWLRTRETVYLTLARRWAKGTAIMFAVGAVSGTALSFELGLLWPNFMEVAGPIVGMPFSLEGFAFFLEAVFLGIYLYGWDRVPEKIHWLSGVMVAFCGSASGFLVIAANGWMNSPQGFDVKVGEKIIEVHSPGDFPAGLSLQDVEVVAIRPWEAMFNPSFLTQAVHMGLAAFVAVGFAVAAIHARELLKNNKNVFHRKAFLIALTVGGGVSFLMPISGDFSAKHLAKEQPVKLAAMEGHWETEAGAPLIIGGIPDQEAEETPYAIRIPYLLSIMSYSDPDAVVMGLKDVPKDERPPVAVTHISFQVMIAAGMSMMLIAAIGLFLRWRRRDIFEERWFLKLVLFSGPLGFIALEAGWFVTEVGRQPWIARGIMRTKDAVTPMPGLIVPFIAFTVLYFVLGVVVVVLLRHQVFQSPDFATPHDRIDLPDLSENSSEDPNSDSSGGH